MPIARATFRIQGWDESPLNEGPGLPKMTRSIISYVYEGELAGSGSLQYLMFYAADGRATFVGMERFAGTLGGREGSFALKHVGVFANGVATAALSIIEGSGTGALAGISGEAELSAGHADSHPLELHYEFASE